MIVRSNFPSYLLESTETPFKRWLTKVNLLVQVVPVIPDMENNEADYERTISLAKRKFRRLSKFFTQNERERERETFNK